MSDGGQARPGPDGRRRCLWALRTNDEMTYHDREWGVAVREDQAMFERICLEAFQAGLSWLTVLRKRDALRTAFCGFDPSTVASFGEREVSQLLGDARIIRSRAKIEAVVCNARAALDLPGGLSALVWGFAPDHAPAPRRAADVAAATPASAALARELKRRGFSFVGPTTAYATMQAAGLVNDHLQGCFRRKALTAR